MEKKQELDVVAKLIKHVANLQNKSPFYQALLKNHAAINFSTLEEFAQLPVTSKDDLQQYNEDFYAVSPDQFADVVSTSGTLGAPVFVPLTEADLSRLSANEAYALSVSGITKQDVVCITTTLDKRFMAGMAYYLGVRAIGATAVRTGPGVLGLQWDSILKTQVTAIIGVPSFMLKLIEYALKEGIDLNQSSVKKIICIGEPIRDSKLKLNALGEKITRHWKVGLFSTYASTEMATAFNECQFQMGAHHNPALVYVELLDEAGQQVPDGTVGEITVTSFDVEAMPLLRFKTGDMAYKISAPCSCGRPSFRLSPIVGRKQHLIKLKGTNVYPAAIENVLHSFEAINKYLLVIASDASGADQLTIKLGNESNAHSMVVLAQLKEMLQSNLRVTPKVEWAANEAIDAMLFRNGSRKPMKVLDLR